MLSATFTGAQLLQAARFDEVLWIDRWGAPEDDMDNARIQGGANHVETLGGYTGLGITGHQMEGLNASHQDWNNTPISFPSGCSAVSGHGHNTAGIVYGNGSSSSLARGMAPDAQAVYTSCRTNRYNNLQSLIATHEIMFTTASWGSPRTRSYTSVSAEADDICFDQDLVWTNSQSNAGNRDSRAEAWAKNVFAIGGVRHRNNSNPLDDSWAERQCEHRPGGRRPDQAGPLRVLRQHRDFVVERQLLADVRWDFGARHRSWLDTTRWPSRCIPMEFSVTRYVRRAGPGSTTSHTFQRSRRCSW